jgi:tungstate transport system substrate-binding protein
MRLAPACVLAGVLAACARAPVPLILATTTSVANSGLVDRLLPDYPAPVRTSAVGSGLALELLSSGDADVAITHAPEREAQILREHPAWSYRKVLWNEFVIVGPAADPARIASAADAVSAMRRIARSGARFISRGDDSGTHERERALWGLAGAQPGRDRLVVAGASMGQTLRIAGGTGAYTLTDEGTFEALRGSLALQVLHKGDPRLLNTYAVVADPRDPAGMRFAEWLAEGAGRSKLNSMIAGGVVRGFHLWPDDVPRDRPEYLPR